MIQQIINVGVAISKLLASVFLKDLIAKIMLVC